MRSARDLRGPTDDFVPEPPDLLVAAVPEPRPEVLARVLAGLRALPDAPGSCPRPATPGPRPDHHGGADDVLPRRLG